jgi:chemotaxis protein MotB
MGPGGASTSMIKLGGLMSTPSVTENTPVSDAAPITTQSPGGSERERLESLMQDLREAIGKSQALEPCKDQLLIDLAPEGLRIEIVDALNRPMFDLGHSISRATRNSFSPSWRST